jgi:tRNA 2-thiouridine synthesizing protein A
VSDHPRPEAGSAPSPAVDAEWDAGDLGCGELVLELRMRMGAMRSGQVLRLTASDPGAPQDLPAWCRMTGHTLVSQQHPVYLIRRR